jgi:hypothetical protein
MDFSSFAELAAHFSAVERRVGPAIVKELQAQGQAIEAQAKARFGTYQAGWAHLKESTMRDRERKGFTPNDPLFRSGALRDSVGFTVEGESLFVGIEPGKTLQRPSGKSVDAALVMAVHENGSTDGRVPARPVFGIVAEELENNAYALGLGIAARAGL